MGRTITQEQADADFRAAGLEPLTPYRRLNDEREATCTTCGTWRRVTLRSVRDPTCSACRWCYGWRHWGDWGDEVRAHTMTWRKIRGPDFSAHQVVDVLGAAPLTRFGDEFTPIGCLCLGCGETFVVIPERISADRPDWSGCQRCFTAANRVAAAEATRVYADAGLTLLAPVRGRWAMYPCTCHGCGTTRRVRYVDALNGTGPACWTCTHGIRPDEPHRIYLFHFADLGVYKVGITHDRHDTRLLEHQVYGGQLLQTVRVPDRDAALAVEAWILASRRPWLRQAVGPTDFPQGGWTEAWAAADAPGVDLAEICAVLGQRTG